jgi:hypothetical protein
MINHIVSGCGSLASGTRWYIFGSSIEDYNCFHDVDLLIVYPDDDLERAISLMNLLEELPEAWNLDLVVLNQTEEAEVDFVAHEHAVLVWPVD